MMHEGEILEKVIRQKNTNITQLAKKIGVSPRQVYNYFKADRLNFEMVAKIGRVIRYDFSHDFPDLKKYPEYLKIMGVHHDENEFKSRLNKCLEERDHWRNEANDILKKYTTLLESHNRLLEQSLHNRNRQTG